MNFAEKFDEYNHLLQEIHDYFGYKEDWVTIPIQDYRNMYWCLDQEGKQPGSWDYYEQGGGRVMYFEEPLTPENVEAGSIYSASIYTQRFLRKWVYRGEDFTMISIDTHTDGNKCLAIFDNKKEIVLTPELKEKSMIWAL